VTFMSSGTNHVSGTDTNGEFDVFHYRLL
jgi:hypothetical protein